MTGRRGNSLAPGHDPSDLNPFPLGFALSVSVSAISIFLIIPMIAYVVPPRDRTDFAWWNQAVVRPVHVSDVSGGKDLQGLVGSGVDALWITGIDDATWKSDSPPFPGGQDALNALSSKLHTMGIKLLVDFPSGHTDVGHPWFKSSRQGMSKHKHHYVWEDAGTASNGTRIPPNNWVCQSGGPAWSWDEGRKQYYLHQKHPDSPDLNYRNEDLQKHMTDALMQWTEAGVDGLVMKDVHTLVEEVYLRDEPLSYSDTATPGDHDFLRHIYTHHQPASHDIISSWRHSLDVAGCNHTVLIADIGDNIDTKDNTGNQTQWSAYYNSGANLVVNTMLVRASSEQCDAHCLAQTLKEALDMVPLDKWPNWLLPTVCSGGRVTSRQRLMLSVGFLLPGAVILEHTNDCKEEVSEILRELSAVREIPAFKWGQYDSVISDNQVMSFLRYALGKLYERYLVVVNFGNMPAERNYQMTVVKVKIPLNGTVLFSTQPVALPVGGLVNFNQLALPAGHAAVIKFPSGAI